MIRSTEGAGETRRRLVELCSEGRLGAAHIRLLDSGLDAARHPDLWEFLERQAVEAGDAALAHRVRRELMAADVAGADVVLELARHALDHDHPGKAQAFLEKAFGPDPSNSAARILLGVALAKADRGAAVRLLEKADCGNEADLLLAVDALRDLGELKRARRLCEVALERWPENAVFSSRLGWIAEGMGDFATACSVAAAEVAGGGDGRAQALLRLVRLHRRQGNRAEMLAHAVDLLRLEGRVLQKLRLAQALRQPQLLQHLVGSLPARFAQGRLDAGEADKIAVFLIDEGYIGLVLFLWSEGVPIGPSEKQLLQNRGLGGVGGRHFPCRFEDAVTIRSPDIVFPLYPERHQAAPPDAWLPALRETDPVLLVNSVLAAGGAERQFLMVVRALVAAGVAPHRLHAALFSLESDRGHSHFEDALRATGVQVHNLSELGAAGRAMPERDWGTIALLPAKLRADVWALWHLVQRIEPAVIHGWQDRASMAAGLVGQMLDVRRIVLSVRNMRPSKRVQDFDWIARAVYTELLQAPSVAITANASEAARDYEDWLRLPHGRVSMLSNAIDETLFSAAHDRRRSVGPVRILGIFRLTENKRPVLWLETIAALRNVHGLEISPHIVGMGSMADEVRRSAERLGLSHLRLDPPVQDPSDFYRNSDALLLMSSVEGTPNVVLEAQACGLPVAACRVGGVAEALHLEGEGAGLLLGADVSAEDAAAAIARWMPRALAAPSAPRVAFVQERYSMAALAENLLGLYGAQT